MSLTVETLVRVPWTIRGPQRCADRSGEWYEIRVDELPAFFVADLTRDAVMAEYVPALTAFLASYTEAERAALVSPAVLWRWLTILTSPSTATGMTSGERAGRPW